MEISPRLMFPASQKISAVMAKSTRNDVLPKSTEIAPPGMKKIGRRNAVASNKNTDAFSRKLVVPLF